MNTTTEAPMKHILGLAAALFLLGCRPPPPALQAPAQAPPEEAFIGSGTNPTGLSDASPSTDDDDWNDLDEEEDYEGEYDDSDDEDSDYNDADYADDDYADDDYADADYEDYGDEEYDDEDLGWDDEDSEDEGDEAPRPFLK